MKFPLSESNNHSKIIQTNCKNCAFAVYEKDTQIGCLHGRVDKFKNLNPDNVLEAYDIDKNFYVINKFCNFYRDKDSWNNGILDTKKIRQEAKLTFDVFLNCDNINTEYLEWIKEFIKNINDYGSDKVHVHIYHNDNLQLERKKEILSLLPLLKIYTLNVYLYNADELKHNIILKSKQSYHLDISSNNTVDFDILSQIDIEINDNLKRLLAIKLKNNYVYSNLSYKIEGLNDKNIAEITNKILNFSKPDYYDEL